jgi:hypothetical protein
MDCWRLESRLQEAVGWRRHKAQWRSQLSAQTSRFVHQSLFSFVSMETFVERMLSDETALSRRHQNRRALSWINGETEIRLKTIAIDRKTIAIVFVPAYGTFLCRGYVDISKRTQNDPIVFRETISIDFTLKMPNSQPGDRRFLFTYECVCRIRASQWNGQSESVEIGHQTSKKDVFSRKDRFFSKFDRRSLIIQTRRWSYTC